MQRFLLPLLALGILLGGCSEKTTAPGRPPAAPQGLYGINGQHQVTLVWLANAEPDLQGYRIYDAPCDSCLYTRIGVLPATARAEYEQFVATGLADSVRRFFAVSAVDREGRESDLSRNSVWGTPRPEGSGLSLNNFVVYQRNVGYDFSAFAALDTTSPPADIFYGYYEDQTHFVHQQVFVPDYASDIQDAGYASSLDAVYFAPDSGWSPSGTVEAIAGHNYVVWTRENRFAKFRVQSVDAGHIVLDWAYQGDRGNPDLRAKRAVEEGAVGRRPIVWLRR
jgi:hypothetical protein